MKRIFLSYVLGLCLCQFSVAQMHTNNITTQWLGWYHLEGVLDISPKWQTVLELEDRRFQYVSNEHQYFSRFQLIYKLNKVLSAGAGFAYFGQEADSLRSFDDPLGTELRPHQQLSFEKENSRHTWLFRLRLEERFLRDITAAEIDNTYSLTFRLRLRPEWQFTLIKQKKDDASLVDFTLYDEFMIQAGNEANLFNQNRLYGGFIFYPSKSVTVEAGYLNAFQLRDSGDAYWSRHIIRLGLIFQWQLHP